MIGLQEMVIWKGQLKNLKKKGKVDVKGEEDIMRELKAVKQKKRGKN